MSMTTRGVTIPLLALALALLLTTACGGGDDGERPAGRLTDPRSVATATPRAYAPEPIILDPGALTPISETEGDEDGEEEPGVEVTPVTPFKVISEGSSNLRTRPSTESDIAGIIAGGDEETVVGQVGGEEVEEGNDIWYQLEGGSFVYSGAVTRAEE